MRIRKQVDELTSEDFENFSCWEYASNEEGVQGQDECTIRPGSVSNAEMASQQIFVQAAFLFPNGRIRTGAVTINAGEDISSHQPVLFTPKEPLHFYCGAIKPSEKEVERFRKALKRICPEPYPLRYVTALHGKAGQPLASGVLEGLYWLADWRAGKVDVVV
jgi:hypothetical protein